MSESETGFPARSAAASEDKTSLPRCAPCVCVCVCVCERERKHNTADGPFTFGVAYNHAR